MDSFQFRPTVTDLEDRITPASPAELMNIMQQVSIDTQSIQRIAHFASEPRSLATLSQMSIQLADIARRSESYGGELGEFFGQLVTAVQANPAIYNIVLPYAMPVATKLMGASINSAVSQNTLAFTTSNITKQGGTIPDLAFVNPPAPPAPPETPPAPPAATQPDGPVDANGVRLTLPDLDSPEWMDVGDGLRTWDTVVGDGPVVGPTDTVTFNYRGWLRDTGVEFDSSLDNGPLTSSLAGGLIEGFTRLIPGMQPGGIRRLDIPSEFAYGERGSGSSIPPNADLVFEVQMISSTPPTGGTGTTTGNVPISTSGNTGIDTVPTNGSTGPLPGTDSTGTNTGTTTDTTGTTIASDPPFVPTNTVDSGTDTSLSDGTSTGTFPADGTTTGINDNNIDNFGQQ